MARAPDRRPATATARADPPKAGPRVIPIKRIEQAIVFLRGHKVMLDTDLAALYGVSTKRLNEQVKRNSDRFPSDFSFQLTRQEHDVLRSQLATLEAGRRSAYRHVQPGAGWGYPPTMQLRGRRIALIDQDGVLIDAKGYEPEWARLAAGAFTPQLEGNPATCGRRRSVRLGSEPLPFTWSRCAMLIPRTQLKAGTAFSARGSSRAVTCKPSHRLPP